MFSALIIRYGLRFPQNIEFYQNKKKKNVSLTLGNGVIMLLSLVLTLSFSLTQEARNIDILMCVLY